ncbi:MAG: hypothetical protein JXA21_28430 [Anaerolineae bacterium]|nr:hypothetical protein [Anaerolineae bacterium]
MEKQNRMAIVRPWKKFLVVGLLVAVALLLVHAASAAPRAQYSYNNGRFGFGLSKASDAVNYDVPMLNAGWYWDWAAKGPSQIPPLEYMQRINLSPVKSGSTQIGYTASPTGTQLRNLVLANPGATWMIGNEPDCSAMDNMVSTWYARAYHDVYTAIKSIDPTAKIAAGNIVQPTQQRFMYLDRILATYLEEYGEPLPADLWVTHAYILCEKCYPYRAPGEPFAWGACWVPDWPGYNESLPYATFYSVYDHWNIEIFKERMIAMRQWMYDNGYRNHPLLIAEYGILFYDGLVYGGAEYETLTKEFMNAGFDWMRSARDSELGFALDDGRLVQRWAWYSLNHDDYRYGGSLFSPHTYQPTYLGIAFGDYTSQISPTVDLNLWDFEYTHSASAFPVSFTATFTVANAGDVTAVEPLSVRVYDSQYPTIDLAQIPLEAIPCCGNHRQATLPWQKTSPALQEMCVQAVNAQASSDPVCITFGADSQVAKIWAQTHTTPTGTTPVSATVYAKMVNAGNLGTEEPVTVAFLAQTPGAASATLIGEAVAPPLACCGDSVTVSVPWVDYTRGSTITARATTSYQTSDSVPVTLHSQLVITRAWAPAIHDLSGNPITATLHARVVNVGVVDTLSPMTVSFYVPGTSIIHISDTVLLPPLPCCEAYVDVTTSWPELPSQGFFNFCAVAATAEEVSPPSCGVFFVNPKECYLPIVMRD